MAKGGGGMGILLLGGGALALFMLTQQKAQAADTPTPAAPKPKPLPAPAEDDEGGGGGGGGGGGFAPAPAPEGAPIEERPIATPAPATVPISSLNTDERAKAIAAAKKASELEAAKKAAARPAPTVTPAGNLEPADDDTPTPGTAVVPASGMTTAPIVTMPAAKPTGYDPTGARAMAANVAANIKNKKTAYDRKQLASFQTKAGLGGDGLYGPLSVSALKFYGVKSPPAALFKGTIKEYTPPA